MENNVLITIAGKDNSGNEGISLMTQGVCRECDGKMVLEYDETELTGMDGCKARITFDKGDVSMERDGCAHTYMSFSPQKWSSSTYETPMGMFSVDVYPTRVVYSAEPYRGWLDLQYELQIGDYSQVNRIMLHYESPGR